MALNTSSIDPLFNEAKQATDKAIGLASSGANLPQQLREAVTGRLEKSPLFGQREEAAKQVLTSGSRARESVADTVRSGKILSPTQQQSVISARGAADVVPLTSLNDLLTTRIGGVDTAVNTGLNAFQTMLQNAQNLATTKTDQAQNAFGRLLDLAANDRAERTTNKSLGQVSFLEKILSQLGAEGGVEGGDQPQQQFEGAPQFSPPDGEGSQVVDDETNIIWQFSEGQWIPAGEIQQEQPGFLQNIFGGL